MKTFIFQIQREEPLERTQPQIYECLNTDDNLAEEPKADVSGKYCLCSK